MLLANLNSGRGTLLTSPRAMRPHRAARSMNGATVLFVAMRHVLRVLSMWRGRSGRRRTLAELDDRLLQDIGLTRADVELSMMKPFWRAPYSARHQ